MLRAALSSHDEKLLPGHWARFTARSVLGEALAGRKKSEEGEPRLLQGYEGMKDNPAAPAIRKREALERIPRLYEAWGKPDQAKDWRATLEAGSPDAAHAP